MNKIHYFNALNNTKLTKDNLLCSLCSSWLFQPIFITSVGQNICSCTKGKQCTRNKPLEMQLEGVKYPCYNMNCFISSKAEDFPVHQQLCWFADLQCPLCEVPDLNDYTIVAHLKEHEEEQMKTKETQTVFSYQEQTPKVQLKLSTENSMFNTIHVITIQNGSVMVVWHRPVKDTANSELTIGQIHSAENENSVRFNFIHKYTQDGEYKVCIKRNVVSMRNLFNIKLVSAHLENIAIAHHTVATKKVVLYFADFEKCALMKCPQCNKFLTNKIYFCANQHTVCSRCKPTITGRPSCRGAMNKTGIDLSRMLPNVSVPCENVERGCLVFGTNSDHNNECLYKSYKCPWKDCNFNHCQSRVITHMKDEHHVYHMGYGLTLNAINTFAFIERDGELFKVYVDDIESDIVQLHVQMQLDNRNAWKLRYTIRICQPDDFSNEVLNVGNFVHGAGKKKVSCPVSIESIYALCKYFPKVGENAINIKVYIF